MARILFLEDDPVAIKAMEGIMRRSPHELIHVDRPQRVADILEVDLDYDLLIAEPRLKEESAVSMLKELRKNPYLKLFPIVIYSKIKDKKVIHNLMKIGVQNFLIKPYKEHGLLDEIQKDTSTDWRVEASGGKKRFYHQLDNAGTTFREKNEKVYNEMRILLTNIEGHIEVTPEDITQKLMPDFYEIIDQCEEIAFPVLKEEMERILDFAREEMEVKLLQAVELFQYAVSIQKFRLDYIDRELSLGDFGMDGDDDDDGFSLKTIDGDRHTIEEVEERIEAMKDYPVIESAAASFQMCLDQDDMNLDEVVEMIQRDAGLAASVLRCSNMSNISPGQHIGDVHQAVTVLGLRKVKLLAVSLKTMPDICSMFKVLKWEDLWMHQVGCAMLCEDIATRLKLGIKTEEIYIAGLIHDMGKILLNEIDPKAYRSILNIAKEQKRPLQLLEQEAFGCSHEYAAYLFAKQSEIPETIQKAILYQFDPLTAPDSHDMVGVLSLASYLCMKHEIGDNGDRPIARIRTVISHPGWNALQPLLAPQFRITAFMRELESRIKTLKVELAGLVQEEIELRKRAGYNL